MTAYTLRTPEPLTEAEEALYEKTVSQLLTEDLWTPRDMYDASHCLMVPMHYAFASGDQDKISAFHQFFTRFYEDISGQDTYAFSQQRYSVDKIQFLYFCCEYLRLCAHTGAYSLAPAGLYDYLYREIEYLFTESPANWGVEKNTQTHIEQAVMGKEYAYHYYAGLSDSDLYPLAALCDLRVVAILSGEEDTELMEEAAFLAYAVFASPDLITETEKGGWLMQVGVWNDYPDFQYAGNQEVTPDIQPDPREDIVFDSSHFTRYALWLSSFQLAQTYREQYDLLKLRREQLANQLVNYVVQYVDGAPLASTFMDGTCGVYRYREETGVGLQGYSLSGTLLMGWWSFLEDPKIDQLYQDLLAQFPMTAGLQNPYFDYATTREQNPFFDMDTSFENGMMECMTMLASK